MVRSITLRASVALMKGKLANSTAGIKTTVPVSGGRVAKSKSRPRRKMADQSRSKGQSEAVKMSPVCTNCRERHLKCSGPPLCVRCRSEGTQCMFVPSRRGKRPPKEPSPAPDPTVGSSAQPRYARILPSSSSTSLNTLEVNIPRSRSPALVTSSTSAAPTPSLSQHFINLAYANDLCGHPFVLPKNLLLEKISRAEIQCLRVVVEYLGMSYDPMNSSRYSPQIERMLFSQQFTKNAYTVQAYLLLAIKLSSRHDPRAVQCLQWASSYAVEIGMNKQNFPQLHSGGSQEQEESWTSTWTVLTQLCQMWSLSNVGNAASQGATVEVGSRRSSSHLVADQIQPQTRSRHASVQSQGYPGGALSGWQNTPPDPSWTLVSQSHTGYEDHESGAFNIVQPVPGDPSVPDVRYMPSVTASQQQRHTWTYDEFDEYLSQFPRP